MVTIADEIAAIKAATDYIQNSLILKSVNDTGAVFKWLIDVGGVGKRQERFFATDIADSDKPLEDRTVILKIDIDPPT